MSFLDTSTNNDDSKNSHDLIKSYSNKPKCMAAEQ